MAPPKSSIWTYFIKRNNMTATCKNCLKVLKTSGNTSNLRSHLKQKHSHLLNMLSVSDGDNVDGNREDYDKSSGSNNKKTKLTTANCLDINDNYNDIDGSEDTHLVMVSCLCAVIYFNVFITICY